VIAVSTGLLEAIRYPHLLAVEAVAYPPVGDPVALPLSDGSVTIDRTADHRRRLDLTLAPNYPVDHPLAGQEVYPDDPGDPLSVYGAEIIVKRGVRFANETIELVQLGVFRVEDASVSIPGGEVQVSGWDRSRQVLDERFVKPRRFDAQLATTLIQLLITEVHADAVFDVQTSDSTMLRKHVVDQDRWPEVQRIANLIGCDVYPDEQGVWIIADSPDPGPPVWTVDAGPGGVLVSASNSVTREGVPNAVVTTGETFSGNRGAVTISHAAPAIVTQAGHGLVANQQVSFHTGGTLPAPLTQGTTYWAAILSSSTFKVSATRAGPAIDTTTAGSGSFSMDVVGIPVWGIATDDDPNSPTLYGGPYGQIPKFYSSGHISTQSQANKVASKQLAAHLGATRIISFDSVPNPALDAGDSVSVVYPDGHSELHIIDALQIPLSPAGVMTAETRALTWTAT
jgi:hypothetical protein